MKEKKFSPKNYPDYNFDLSTGERPQRNNYGENAPPTGIAARFQKEVRQGETDAAGRGTAAYALPEARDLGTLEGVAFATIFDETGRPVNRLATFAVQTQAAMFGIQNLPELVSTR